MKLKKHQEEGLKAAVKHFKNNKHFRYNMFTGSGKTVLAIHTADKLSKGNIIVCVHTNILKEQFLSEVKKHSSKKSKYIVDTYQSIRNRKDISADFLIVDEVHQGGQTGNGSYFNIIKNLKPRKILSLSATDDGVSEKLFDSSSFIFDIKDASSRNLINNCDLIVIDAGLVQRLSDGSYLEDDDLKKLYDKDKKKGVDLKDSTKRIVEGSIREAISVYKKMERGNSAILFAPNIEMAEYCFSLCGGIKAAVTHSLIRNHGELIEKFKTKEIDLLIAVRQVQEGFDMPDLEVIFDCSPSFRNDGRIFKQRIGRVLRKKRGKKTSRYYILNRVNNFTETFGDKLSTHIKAKAILDGKTNKSCNKNLDILVTDNNRRSSLFISNTKKSKIVKTIDISNEMKEYKKYSEKYPEMLISMAEKGLSRPKRGDPINSFLNRITNKNSRYFDRDLYGKLKSLAPIWFFDPIRSLESLINRVKSLDYLPTYAEDKALRSAIHRYSSEKSEYFNKEFSDFIKDKFEVLKKKKNIKKAKKKKKKKNNRDIIAKKVIRSAINGRRRPRDLTKLLERDADLKKELKEIRPDWFGQRALVIKRELQKEIIYFAVTGLSKPVGKKNRLANALLRYASKNDKSYDEEFIEKLKKIRPDWFNEKKEGKK